jgi:hypothetical protein
MNSYVILIIDDVQGPQIEQTELEGENNNMYRIIGIIDGHYIVQTPNYVHYFVRQDVHLLILI